MTRFGWLVVGALLVGLAGAVVGCSDDGDAVAEAEELALAVLLVEGDLPAGDWEVMEAGIEEWLESMLMAAERAEAVPEECGGSDQVFDATQAFNGVLAMQLRSFVAEDNDAGIGDVAAIALTAMVFESAERVQALVGDSIGWGEPPAQSQACLDARAVAMGAEAYEVRIDAPRFSIADEQGFRRTTTMTFRTNTVEFVMEQHTFVRGRIMASYMALGSDDAAREVDHQALLEAFEVRVVGAQE